MFEYILGPFTQIVTMQKLPAAGPIDDSQLQIVKDADIWVKEGKIFDILPYKEHSIKRHEVIGSAVALPGFIDAHTHLCFAGTRAADYASRLCGASYQQIAEQGGGILSTVEHTRAASQQALVEGLLHRLKQASSQGVTTCEIKSGYGLNIADELKMLKAIQQAASRQDVTLIPTCLAAHTLPKEFAEPREYLKHLLKDLLPQVKQQRLAKRVDIFVDGSGFTSRSARSYLETAKKLGFSLVIHADQFKRGGALLAAAMGALSADHLEMTSKNDANALLTAGVIPIVLPGATLGLGMPFAPARMLLDAGLPLVIASDWNPGSSPMGDLLTTAALLGAAQHLTTAETFAALTTRAAKALELNDRAVLAKGMRADIAIYPCNDYREILYHQGGLVPSAMIIAGKKQ